jgi:hypothetical protein
LLYEQALRCAFDAANPGKSSPSSDRRIVIRGSDLAIHAGCGHAQGVVLVEVNASFPQHVLSLYKISCWRSA